MNHEAVTELLPDFILGTLSEAEQAAVRRHLRGCGTCRAEAGRMDEGVALFASAAHSVDPSPELRDRVLRVVSEEWAHVQPAAITGPVPGLVLRRSRPLVLVAAVVAVLAGALAWGAVNQVRASHLQADAAALREFLATLGGKDVRVGSLKPAPAGQMQGSIVIYDANKGEQSWVLVLVRSAGYRGPAKATLLSPSRWPIALHPIEIEADGDGWTALFTNSDLSLYENIHIRAPDGELLASGHAGSQHL